MANKSLRRQAFEALIVLLEDVAIERGYLTDAGGNVAMWQDLPDEPVTEKGYAILMETGEYTTIATDDPMGTFEAVNSGILCWVYRDMLDETASPVFTLDDMMVDAEVAVGKGLEEDDTLGGVARDVLFGGWVGDPERSDHSRVIYRMDFSFQVERAAFDATAGAP